MIKNLTFSVYVCEGVRVLVDICNNSCRYSLKNISSIVVVSFHASKRTQEKWFLLLSKLEWSISQSYPKNRGGFPHLRRALGKHREPTWAGRGWVGVFTPVGSRPSCRLLGLRIPPDHEGPSQFLCGTSRKPRALVSVRHLNSAILNSSPFCSF